MPLPDPMASAYPRRQAVVKEFTGHTPDGEEVKLKLRLLSNTLVYAASNLAKALTEQYITDGEGFPPTMAGDGLSTSELSPELFQTIAQTYLMQMGSDKEKLDPVKLVWAMEKWPAFWVELQRFINGMWAEQAEKERKEQEVDLEKGEDDGPLAPTPCGEPSPGSPPAA